MAALLTDEDLSAALAGDPSGFSAVYKALSPAVLGYFRARGADDPEALTQDVFVDVLPKLGGISGGEKGLRTFIFSVAHARLVDYRRREARTPILGEYDPLDDGRRSASAEEHLIDSLGGGITELLQLLNDEQREVLVLRIVADLSIEQVAGIMDKSTGAVKQLQRRALVALRELVTEKDYTAS